MLPTRSTKSGRYYVGSEVIETVQKENYQFHLHLDKGTLKANRDKANEPFTVKASWESGATLKQRFRFAKVSVILDSEESCNLYLSSPDTAGMG